MIEHGRVASEADPLEFGFCLVMREREKVYQEIAELISASVDYLHRDARRGSAVLLRAAAELFIAHHLLGDPTENASLDGFGHMIERVRDGEGVAAGMTDADRSTLCRRLSQIALLGDTAAHPRMFPPARSRIWSRGQILEDMNNFEKIVRLTVPWCNT